MKAILASQAFWLLCVAGLITANVGCTPKTPKEKAPDAKVTKEAKKSDTAHEGWWCQEHGVPEDICSLCSTEAAAKFKKDGDWCKIHDRAKSQCFKCEPKNYEKFEAMYVAKYNKKPERPPQEEFEK